MEGHKEVAPEIDKNKEPEGTLDKICDVQKVREHLWSSGQAIGNMEDKQTRQTDIEATARSEAIGESARVVRTWTCSKTYRNSHQKGDGGHQFLSSKETAGWVARAYKGGPD